MKFGVNVTTFKPDLDVADIARRVEELGFESFWLPEHILYPMQPKSAYYGASDGKIPSIMEEFMDPYVGLARASAVTKRILLGTSISLVPEHNPLVLAKRISTLDYFSRGRFLFGMGMGWLQEEGEIMKVDWEHRWAQTRECILVLKELWTKESAEFHGKYYNFPLVRMYPKPFIRPHPPMIMGGTAKNVFKRVAALCDGWMPSHATPEMIREGWAELEKECRAIGRDPASVEITAFGPGLDISRTEEFEKVGAKRMVVRLEPPTGRKEGFKELEEYARTLKKHLKN
jgi:probable F420-dependent oxidoreductase